jgi:hypothetical protein
MRRTASEFLRSLEMRVARLERIAGSGLRGIRNLLPLQATGPDYRDFELSDKSKNLIFNALFTEFGDAYAMRANLLSRKVISERTYRGMVVPTGVQATFSVMVDMRTFVTEIEKILRKTERSLRIPMSDIHLALELGDDNMGRIADAITKSYTARFLSNESDIESYAFNMDAIDFLGAPEYVPLNDPELNHWYISEVRSTAGGIRFKVEVELIYELDED